MQKKLAKMESNIVGAWYNELGSMMVIDQASEGQFSGYYYTAVGHAQYTYTLTGRYDTVPDGKTLGWTVTYTNSTGSSGSTCCWSGQYQEPTILTTWLLTDQTKPSDDWNSTHVGFDTFTKEMPSPEVIKRAKSSGRMSHPKTACPKAE